MANQDAAAFAPNRADIGDEERRDRVYNQVEARVAERREIGHVAVHKSQFKPVPLRHESILAELTRRPVEQRDLRAGRGEDGRLLSATTRQAQDPETRERREPLARDRPMLAQLDGPGSGPRIGNLLTRDHLGVGVLTALERLVPGRIPELTWSCASRVMASGRSSITTKWC
jgi:hypothetical protein